MKKILVLLLVSCFTYVGCDITHNTTSSPEEGETTLPHDQVRDVKKDPGSPFDYSTVSPVKFRLQLKDSEEKGINNAFITVTDNKENVICVIKSYNGNVDFNAAIDKVAKAAIVKIQHRSYEERIIEIQNVNEYLEINRTLFLANVIKDQKLDDFGIEDEYADATHFLFAKKKFIVAYEDLYPVVGDADFNDTVAFLDIRIYTEITMRYVNRVIIHTTILASGTGLEQYLRINIIGKLIKESDYKLGVRLLVDEDNNEVHVRNTLYDSGTGTQYNNCVRQVDAENGPNGSNEYHEDYYKAKTFQQVIDYDPVICTLHFPPMPFDPYIRVIGHPEGFDKTPDIFDSTQEVDSEVHLSMVETPYRGKRTDTASVAQRGADGFKLQDASGNDIIEDYENFPWALVFPVDALIDETWRWPLETWGESDININKKASIFNAYPYFKNWHDSDGQEYEGWYLLPAENNTDYWLYTGDIIFPIN
jgi:LruC domain-containing protein